ncbi:MAG: hypothetical protein IJT60_08320 [Clostridia bacterium]|nr:hypothetical protein [Clostridia bacterium]
MTEQIKPAACGPDGKVLTPEEKKLILYNKQKQILDLFLERGAISQAQYDKSLGDMAAKMGIEK